MTAPAQPTPASRAAHALIDAIQVLDGITISFDVDPLVHMSTAPVVGLLTEAAEHVAAIQQELDGLRADKAALEQLDTRRVLVIADLKARLARAAEELESLYVATNHAVQTAANEHLSIIRARRLLDLNTPLEPTRPTLTGAPRAAATH